jgi:hypothetical protein
MGMINCTELFVDAEWAAAHIHDKDTIRVNIQQRNRIYCIHMNIDKISPFLERVRREQQQQRHQESPSNVQEA